MSSTVQQWCDFAHRMQMQGMHEEAAAAYRNALQLAPEISAIHYNLGTALAAIGNRDEAIESFRRATALDPEFASAHFNLANSLKDDDDLEGSLESYRQAIRLKPDNSRYQNNYGIALQSAAQFDLAIEAFEKAVELDSENYEAHGTLGMALLLRGDFQRGWAEYEWRWKSAAYAKLPKLSMPRWGGGDLDGRKILLRTEQGFGDTIQFSRYIPMLREKGARIVLLCQPELVPLLREMPEIERVEVDIERTKDCDVWWPLLSLPHIFQTDSSSIPANVPYLKAPAEKSEHWKQRIAFIHAKRKIGLAWAGRRSNAQDSRRSINLSILSPLTESTDATFFAIQKSDEPEELADSPFASRMISLQHELQDFADTAAVIEQMDVMVCVDTAVAHLAGALGKPVWVMLPAVPDWRWMLGRDDSPWYPSMMLFRQQAINDWSPVIRRIAEALALEARPRK